MLMRSLLLMMMLASSGRACELALVFAVDISGSVDAREYNTQMDGLAAALRDGVVVDALIEQNAMLTLIQWTGSDRQRQTIPWTEMNKAEDVYAFADLVSTDKRVWHSFSTAIGEALIAAEQALLQTRHCKRKVVDVSGDGISNEGVSPQTRHAQIDEIGAVVNALAIETDEDDLTGWFFENVIRGDGAFVVTAAGFEDYPAQIKRKLRRETTRQLSGPAKRDHTLISRDHKIEN